MSGHGEHEVRGRTSTTTIRVRWGEADAMGIAFYPNFFAWFDLATHELVRGSGQTFDSMLQVGGYSLPIVESGARFVAPAFFDDELVVTSTVSDLRSRALRVDHAIHRDGEAIATGFEVRVMARHDPTRRGRLEMVPIPDDLRTWLAGE